MNTNRNQQVIITPIEVTAGVSSARNLVSKVIEKLNLLLTKFNTFRNTTTAELFYFESSLAPAIYPKQQLFTTTPSKVKRTNYYFKDRRGCKMRTTRAIFKSIDSFFG